MFHVKKYFIDFFHEISTHPKSASILGAIQAFVFGLWSIDTAVLWLKFVGELFRTLGIVAGSLVAMYGFYKTFIKKEIKKDGDQQT